MDYNDLIRFTFSALKESLSLAHFFGFAFNNHIEYVTFALTSFSQSIPALIVTSPKPNPSS